MKNRIITISREFGSGGRTIGKHVAEKLGVPCYDSEIIEKIAQQSGFTEWYIKNSDESSPSGFAGSLFTGNRSFGPTNEDYIWEIQRKVILNIAEKGPCVIVGRCADYILKDKADCLRVFIHAEETYRADRIVKIYGERTETPMERIRDKDKRRAAYHRFYTSMRWGDAKNYDIALDSGRIGIDKCVDILLDIY